MAPSNPLRRVMHLLGFSSPKEYARLVFGKSADRLYKILKIPVLPEPYRRHLLEYIRTLPEVPVEVFDLLGERPDPDQHSLRWDETGRTKTGWEPYRFEPVERSAWSWGLSFRNSALLEECAGRAIRSGLGCTRIRDGLLLHAPTSGRRRFEGVPLFADPPGPFGLSAGTMLVMGAAPRHTDGLYLQNRFRAILGNDACAIRQFVDRQSYFGYETTLKYLSAGNQTFPPERFAEGESRTVYRDIAAIFHGPAHEVLGDKEGPYREKAKQVVLVQALQRLANGVAMRLITEPSFLARYVGGYNFEDPGRCGILAFRVTVVHDEFGSAIRQLDIINPRDGSIQALNPK